MNESGNKATALYGEAYAEAQARIVPKPYLTLLEPYCESIQSCLDIGSGNGSLLEGIRTFNPEIKTFSADLNTFINQKAVESGIAAVTANAREPLPFPNNHFDLVTSVHAPEHFITADNAGEVMGEFGRVIVKGGHLALVFPCPWLLPQEGAFIDGWRAHKEESLLYRAMHAWQDASQLHPGTLQPKIIKSAAEQAKLSLLDCKLLFVPEEMGRSWWMVFQKQ